MRHPSDPGKGLKAGSQSLTASVYANELKATVSRDL